MATGAPQQQIDSKFTDIQSAVKEEWRDNPATDILFVL